MYLEELNFPFFLMEAANIKIDCVDTVVPFLESADVGAREMDRIDDAINNPKFVSNVTTMLKDTASALESREEELDNALQNLNRLMKEKKERRKIKAFTVRFSEVRTGFLYDYIDFVQKLCERYIKGEKVQDVLDELDGARKVRLKEKVCNLYDARIYENGKILDSVESYEAQLSDSDNGLIRSLKEYKYRLGKDAANTDLDKAGRKFRYTSFTKIAKGYTAMILELNTKFCDIIGSLFKWAKGKKQPEQLGAVTIAVQAYNIFVDVGNFGAAAILAIFTMYSRNLKSATEFFKVYEWNTTGTPTKEDIGMESVEEEEFLFRGHTASLIGIADNFINKLKGIGGYSDTLLEDLSADECMNDLYIGILKDLKSLKDKILLSTHLLNKNEELSLTEVRDNSGLGSDDDIDNLLNVSPILDTSSFENCNFKREVVLADLLRFKDAIPEIAKEFDSLRAGVTFLHQKFQQSSSNLGQFHLNEIIRFLEDLDKKILLAQRAFSKAFGLRLIKLTEGLRSKDSINDLGVDIEDDEYKSSDFMFDEEEEEADESADYEEIVRDVIGRKLQAFHEDGENNQQNNNQQNNQQDKNEAKSPKPQVQDNADNSSQTNNQNNNQNNDQKNQNNDQQNQNNNQSNQNANKDKKTGKVDIAGAARTLLDKIIEQISAFMEKGSKKKNLGFIAKNKDYLLSRNYTNVTVSLLPYLTNTDYAGTMKKVFKAASDLDDQTLKTFTEEQIINRVLAPLKIDKVKGDNLEARVVQALKTGAKPANNVNVSNGDLVRQVPKMIRFCEYYYNSIVPDLRAAQKDLDNLNIFKNKESKGDNDRTSQNVIVVRNCLLATIRGVRTAARDRSNDYMMIINSLSSKNNQNNNDNGENNQNQNNNQNNNQQNQNNNQNGNNQQNNSGNNNNNENDNNNG